MPWIYRNSTVGEYAYHRLTPSIPWSKLVSVVGHYDRIYQSKYSERTPGYPNVFPLPPRAFVREIKVLQPGSIDATCKFTGNYDGKGVKEHTDFITGQLLVAANIGDNVWYPSVPPADPEQRVINRLNVRVADISVNLPVMFAELPETFRMLAKDANTLYRAARDVRRGRFRAAAKRLGISQPRGLSKRSAMFANNWLKYQFGYKPIVSDMVGLMKATCKTFSQDQFIDLKSSETIETPFLKKKVGWVGLFCSTGWVNIEYDVSGTTSVTAKVGYKIRVGNPAAATMASLSVNPVAVAWELIPFSFVVDWFVNVGQCFSALGAWSGKEFVSGYRTKVSRCTAQAFAGQVVAPADTSASVSSPHLGKVMNLSIDRAVLTGPLPTRVVWDLPDSLWHLTTSLSLLRKLF